MPEYDYDDDDFTSGQSDSDLIKDLRRQLKNAHKERDDWKSKYESESNATREFRLRDVLASRGIEDKRAARYLKADGIDLNDEAAVDTWLTENGDLFNYQPRERDEQAEKARDGLARMAAAEEQGVSASHQDEVLAAFAAAQSPEEVDQLRIKYGNLKL